MKKYIGATLLALSLGMPFANADYVELKDVYTYSIGGTISWNHTYNFSEVSPLTASLTIIADDVDGPGNNLNGEQDLVRLYAGGAWHNLGYLKDMGYYTDFNYYPGPGNPNQLLTATVFNLDPSWLVANMPVQVSIESLWGVEIETSTLHVIGTSSVPDGGLTVMLLGIAVSGLIVLRQRFSR